MLQIQLQLLNGLLPGNGAQEVGLAQLDRLAVVGGGHNRSEVGLWSIIIVCVLLERRHQLRLRSHRCGRVCRVQLSASLVRGSLFFTGRDADRDRDVIVTVTCGGH